MSGSEVSGVSRRQFVAAVGLGSVSGAFLAQGKASEQRAGSKSSPPICDEDRPLEQGHERIALIPAKTVLAVIDMQRYFVHPARPFRRLRWSMKPTVP